MNDTSRPQCYTPSVLGAMPSSVVLSCSASGTFDASIEWGRLHNCEKMNESQQMFSSLSTYDWVTKFKVNSFSQTPVTIKPNMPVKSNHLTLMKYHGGH